MVAADRERLAVHATGPRHVEDPAVDPWVALLDVAAKDDATGLVADGERPAVQGSLGDRRERQFVPELGGARVDLVGRRGRGAVPLHRHPGREPRVESDQAPCARGAARVLSGDSYGVSAVAGRLPVSSSTVPTPHVGSGVLCAEVLHPEREAMAQDAQGHLLARLGKRVADDGAVLDPVTVGREPARGLQLDLGRSGAVGRGHGWTHGGGDDESKAECRGVLLHAGWDACVTQMVRLRRSGVVDDQGARFVSVTLK